MRADVAEALDGDPRPGEPPAEPAEELERQAADAAAGRFDRLVEIARADIAAGRSRPLAELLAEDGDEATR